jgi:hypothetical protein
MQPQTLNLVIPQGTTFRRTIALRQTVTLLANAGKLATQIKVAPQTVDYPAGTLWEFRWQDSIYAATLAQPLIAADWLGQDAAIATILPLTQFIPAMLRAQGARANLTGFTARAHIRKNYKAADPLAVFACTVPMPLRGEVAIELSDTVTAALKPNVKDATKAINKSEYLTGSPYVWDLELVDALGTVERLVNGSVLVSPESTKNALLP